jgi:hypothetical protein
VELADQIRRRNSLLVLPPSVPFHPVAALLAFNYLSFPGTKLLWLSCSTANLRAALQYHKSLIQGHANYGVLGVEELDTAKVGESAFVFADARSFATDTADRLYDTLAPSYGISSHYFTIGRALFENLACVFFDFTGEDAWLDTYRPVIKHTLGNIPGWKRLALSSSPSTTTKQVSALVTTLPLEQIVCRALDDPDIARHVQAKHSWQVALSGEKQYEPYAQALKLTCTTGSTASVLQTAEESQHYLLQAAQAQHPHVRLPSGTVTLASLRYSHFPLRFAS